MEINSLNDDRKSAIVHQNNKTILYFGKPQLPNQSFEFLFCNEMLTRTNMLPIPARIKNNWTVAISHFVV